MTQILKRMKQFSLLTLKRHQMHLKWLVTRIFILMVLFFFDFEDQADFVIFFKCQMVNKIIQNKLFYFA